MKTLIATVQNVGFKNPLIPLLKDRVVLSLLAMLVLLFIVDRTQFLPSLTKTVGSVWGMIPFFALAIGFAAFAKASRADTLIAKAFSGHPLRATLVAGLIGAISPFCSCGVIPLIAGLLAAGVPLAPVMAFWIASPIMDPEMFILTAAGISFDFALAKTIAAVAMGLFAGFSVLLIERVGLLASPLKASFESACASSCDGDKSTDLLWRFWRDSNRVDDFKRETISTGLFLGKWLTLAFFLESLMVAYISPDWIVAYVGADNAFAIPLAAIVGAPSYLNGYAAIPLISGLIDVGMAPGAAMAFATAGAVSSIPAAIAVYALVKKPVFMLYLVLGLLGAMASGWVYQSVGF